MRLNYIFIVSITLCIFQSKAPRKNRLKAQTFILCTEDEMSAYSSLLIMRSFQFIGLHHSLESLETCIKSLVECLPIRMWVPITIPFAMDQLILCRC